MTREVESFRKGDWVAVTDPYRRDFIERARVKRVTDDCVYLDTGKGLEQVI